MECIIEEFGKVHDHFLLIGQDNQRRYLPVAELWVRVHSADAALAALEHATYSWGGRIEFVVESDEELVYLIKKARQITCVTHPSSTYR